LNASSVEISAASLAALERVVLRYLVATVMSTAVSAVKHLTDTYD